MSCESLFGRHNFTVKQLLAIVAWLDLPDVGHVYTLNVKWHGIMSSNAADEKIWGALCGRSGLGRGFGACTGAPPGQQDTKPALRAMF